MSFLSLCLSTFTLTPLFSFSVSPLSAAAFFPVPVILRGLSPCPPHLSPSPPAQIQSGVAELPAPAAYPPALYSPMEDRLLKCPESTWSRRFSDIHNPCVLASLTRILTQDHGAAHAPRPEGAQSRDWKVVCPLWGSSSPPSLTSDRYISYPGRLPRFPLQFLAFLSLAREPPRVPHSPATLWSSPGSCAGSGCSR